MELINQQQEFVTLCQEIQANEKIIFMDTEFCRRRTYFAQLSLVQIAIKNRYVLIDILALNDLTPLGDLLSNDQLTKVFHSPDQDFYIFFHLFGTLPKNIFDTQSAAGTIGLESGMGYAKLCKLLLNIQLDKSMQTANWLTRPLRAELLVYAAKDVEYLPPLHRYLNNELHSRNLWTSYQLKLDKLTDPINYQFNPEKLLSKIWLGKYQEQANQHQFAEHLIELIRLREEAAIYYDIPRSFCASDQDLLQLCQKLPKNEAQLKQISLQKNSLIRGMFREKLLNLCNALNI